MANEDSVIGAAADRVLIVMNPTAGAGPRHDAIRQLVDELARLQLVAELVTDLDSLGERASRYQAAGQLRTIVAAGGDGTVAEVVNRTEPATPITVFPLGTANLLANYLQIDGDPAALARVIHRGATRRLDAGRANGRIFLLMVGCGFDADVVERLHERRTGAGITYWTYARPILESIRSYRYPDLRVYCEHAPGGETVWNAFAARWAFVVNLPCYAGGLQLAPEAIGDDGCLNVSTFRNGSLWHGLRYLGYVALGWQRSMSDYRTARVTRVRIESDERVPYQLDGDPGGVLPLEIDVLPGRLTLLDPWGARRQIG